MKASLPISILALLLSVFSLIVALIPKSVLSEQELRKQTDLALARKEKAYVLKWTPRMERIYEDMLGPRHTPFEKQPETLPELLKPALEIITGMSTE